VKQGYKTVDSQSLRQLARFVLHYTGPGEALRARIQRILTMARHGDALATELIQTPLRARCRHRPPHRLRRGGRRRRLLPG